MSSTQPPSTPASTPPSTPASTAPDASDYRFRYTAALACDLETRWQRTWAERGVHTQPNPGEPGFDATKPKFYILDMFPYPSGAGLHVGHPEGYIATDILGRYKVMNGFNVLHPMGWDAFGLPAEQYAIQTGVHPVVTTRKSIDTFRGQLQRFGFGYDWSREFGTIDEDYYRWTQWIFLRIYNAWYDPQRKSARHIDELRTQFEQDQRAVRFNPEAAEINSETRNKDLGAWNTLDVRTQHAVIASYRLAYLGEQTVNWCPKLGTALANEEVINGRSERGGYPVLRKPLRQWMFRITAYGDRLLNGLIGADWPESTRAQQAEWIGRSEGAEASFALIWEASLDLSNTKESPAHQRINALEIYTTRPDTMFGATYMVVAPEHPLIDALLAHPQPQTDIAALSDYVNTARNRSDVDRQEGKEKTGVYTGIDAINPANGQPIPVWTSDYVLMGYGTGAIMAVPAHDQRDFEFAKRFGLPIVDVVYPRVIAAMAYYSRNATDEERQNPRWMTVLADLLGIVTSGDIDPGGFDDALHRVRTVRATTPDTVPARPVNFEGMLTPSDLRGASQVTWIEALDSLGFDSFEALYNRFVDGGFYAHSGEAYTGKGSAVNSASSLIDLNGMGTENAKAAMIDTLERARQGRRKINYRLRDWLFSRQRYWGEPFPIVFDEQGLHHPLDESALPVKLPEMADYQPIESNDPAPLLAKATQWVHTTAAQAGATHLPPATPVTRETNTMPGWAGSCWYYLRYCDPKNNLRFASREAEHYWMGEQGVDLYVGGSEHAVLHLLYARFWHQILFDLGEVSSPEPFKKLFHQGLILSYAFQRKDKSLVAVDAVIERDGAYYEQATGDPVTRTMAKMSKTLKNVVNPDDIIAEFGADTFRLYEMYMGPLEASAPWNTDDIIGLFRFLQRAWRLVIDESTGQLTLLEKSDATIEKKLHRTIAKVGDDIERLAFNTAIAAMIEFVNAATAAKGLSRDQLDRFVRTLAPFCPHMADELWHRLGHDGAVAHAQWSSIDQSMLHDDQIEIPVQIMGKVRAKITIPSDADQKTMEALAMADERVKELLVGKTVQKVVAIPGRMVNIVAN